MLDKCNSVPACDGIDKLAVPLIFNAAVVVEKVVLVITTCEFIETIPDTSSVPDILPVPTTTKLPVLTACANVLPVIVKSPANVPVVFAKALFALLKADCVNAEFELIQVF